MSTLRDLQDEIAEACNADEYLVQGGCKAFAEDRQDALAEIAAQLETVGGIAIAVCVSPWRASWRRATSIDTLTARSTPPST